MNNTGKFTKFTALSVDPRVEISWSALETDYFSYLLLEKHCLKQYFCFLLYFLFYNLSCLMASSVQHSVGWLVVLLFYVHGKHLRSCRDGQLT